MMKTFSSEEAKQEETVNNNDENVLIRGSQTRRDC